MNKRKHLFRRKKTLCNKVFVFSLMTNLFVFMKHFLLNRLWAQKLSVSCAEWASIFVRCHKCKLRHHFYKKTAKENESWACTKTTKVNAMAFVVNIKQIRGGKLVFLFCFLSSSFRPWKSWKVIAVITIEHGNWE